MSSTQAGEVIHAARTLPITFRRIAVAVHLFDAALITVSSVVTGVVFRVSTGHPVGEVDHFVATGASFAMLVVGIDILRGTSRPEELLKPSKQIRSSLLAWVSALFIVLNLLFAWRVEFEFSRGAMFLFFVTTSALNIGTRLLWCKLLGAALVNGRLKARATAVLFSSSQGQEEIARELDNLRRHGLLPLWQIMIAPGAGGVDQQLRQVLRGTNVREVVILCDWDEASTLIDVERLSSIPVPVRYLPLGSARLLCDRPREAMGDRVLIELQRGSLSGGERMAKATFDRSVAAASLLMLVPVFVLVAFMIKLGSRGPVFFRQTRRGFNGHPFEIWKFRTMHVTENGSVVRQAVLGDARVTRVGRFLRRASIDELPQLINVLRGEMSLVGPRPHARSHDDHYDPLIVGYPMRQHVLPGLTGWAQIQGARGETPTLDHMQRRVDYDLWYVRNWSFKRDLWIILQTIRHVVFMRSAY